MKITKLETIRLASRPTLIWVRVHTNDGLIGLGESWFGCSAIEADIHDRIAPALIGADASRIEALNRAMRPYVGFCGPMPDGYPLLAERYQLLQCTLALTAVLSRLPRLLDLAV